MTKTGKMLPDFSDTTVMKTCSHPSQNQHELCPSTPMPALLVPMPVPASAATTNAMHKLGPKGLSQLLQQSLHTRKTSVTEQENYINCVLKLLLWALHTNALTLVFKTSICYWRLKERRRADATQHNAMLQGKKEGRWPAMSISARLHTHVKAGHCWGDPSQAFSDYSGICNKRQSYSGRTGTVPRCKPAPLSHLTPPRSIPGGASCPIFTWEDSILCCISFYKPHF